MVTNKQQLLAMAAEWTTHAKNDIRNQMIAFIENTGTDVETLADVLGISNAEIEQILNGNGEITLSTFAKLLIATDNVLEIKPLASTHVGRQTPPSGGRTPRSNTSRMPRQNGMPQMPMGGMMPPCDRNGRPLPPPPHGMPPMGYPSPSEMGGQMPPMPPRFGGMPGMGQRMQRPFAAQPQPQQPIGPNSEFDEYGKRELINIINSNGWGEEIDAQNMTRGELIDFLDMKTAPQQPSQIATPHTNVALEEVNEEQTAQNAEESANASTDTIARMLATELQNNPHLREIVSRYM